MPDDLPPTEIVTIKWSEYISIASYYATKQELMDSLRWFYSIGMQIAFQYY